MFTESEVVPVNRSPEQFQSVTIMPGAAARDTVMQGTQAFEVKKTCSVLEMLAINPEARHVYVHMLSKASE